MARPVCWWVRASQEATNRHDLSGSIIQDRVAWKQAKEAGYQVDPRLAAANRLLSLQVAEW